jgi:hypothetical protein
MNIKIKIMTENIFNRRVTVDNIELIKPLLTFNNKNDVEVSEFYHVQIMQRKQDGIEGEKPRVIKTYYVDSHEYLYDRYDEMKDIAHVNNARVYINLNVKDYRSVGFALLRLVAELLEQDRTWQLRSAFDSVAGTVNTLRDKRWVVDIDTKDETTINEYRTCINLCERAGNIAEPVLATIPTVNGIHLITCPFNTKQFREHLQQHQLPPIDVHKNNLTLLYY